MKGIEITLQIKQEEFIIENIEPVSKKNILLKELKTEKRKNA